MAGLLLLSVCPRMPGVLGPHVGIWIQEWVIGNCLNFRSYVSYQKASFRPKVSYNLRTSDLASSLCRAH